MLDIAAVQQMLAQLQLDGWFLYDFRGQNVIARRVAQLPEEKKLSRRWCYFIPQVGEPKKLCHAIETGALDHLPGSKTIYLRWQEFEAGIENMLAGCNKIAAEYVPNNRNPYVSKLDAGTVEILKSFGKELIPSGDLIQGFEATWDDEQLKMHLQAAEVTNAAFGIAFGFIQEQIRLQGHTDELAVQARILEFFEQNQVTTYSPPNVSVGAHSGDPHYDPKPETNSKIQAGDFVLIDLWAKLKAPRSVYSDLTRVAFVGETVPPKVQEIFAIVAAARDAGIQQIRTTFAEGRPLQGWQVDDATRAVIDRAGYGQYFFHRTGHSIGQEVHGNGANIDNLETQDSRSILPKTCFSIEPGIYLPEFGVRSEVNVYIGADYTVHVTGGPLQTEVYKIIL